MKYLHAIIFVFSSIFLFGQTEITEVSWQDLHVENFEASKEGASDLEVLKPVFSEAQTSLNGKEVIISGNYHVLNNFGSKSYLLSRDEIIKTPMQGDEVVRLIMKEDPKIYFGRTVTIKGIINVDENPDAETIYYITDVKKVKNTGTIEGED